ncbi:MAG: hypothetical protein LWY06_03130 [Firmicutes bacterium]|nr:hypothetical protein [Bacillota bacterium]
MAKTFLCTVDTFAKKTTDNSSALADNQKVFFPAGKIVPYISIADADKNHAQVVMDYGAGTWFFYKPHTDIELDPDVHIASQHTWTKDELLQQLRSEAAKQGLTLKKQIAYMMATIQWETDATFQPVREAYWRSEEWRKNKLRYYPYYGRGYVQLTWESNYRKYSKILGIDLIAEPDLAMKQENALFILVHGFKNGVFTGYCIEDFINSTETDYAGCRKCINGVDRKDEIANLAVDWESKI